VSVFISIFYAFLPCFFTFGTFFHQIRVIGRFLKIRFSELIFRFN